MKTTKIVAITQCFIFFLSAASTQADITIEIDSLQVKLSPIRGWTVSEITRNDLMICDGSISGQGTVLKINGEWAGSWHGNEVILEASIIVDGEKQVLQDNQSYAGDVIVFYRRTAIGAAYILNCTMTIAPDRLDESILLQGFDEIKVCNVFYGFLGSRANRLTDYVAFGLDGSILKSGRTDKNDNSEINFTSAIAVAQYDPNLADCVLTVCTWGENLELRYFIWDRPVDNKLYARFRSAEGSCGLQNLFELSQSILFFDSPAENWQTDATFLLKSVRCSQKIKADLNNDCKVDFADFAIFSEHWLDCNLDFQEACLGL